MNDEVKLFDVVALVTNLPEYALSKGQVGTVVELLKNGAADEVEFADRHGRTFRSLGLRSDQFMVLHYEPQTNLREPVGG